METTTLAWVAFFSVWMAALEIHFYIINLITFCTLACARDNSTYVNKDLSMIRLLAIIDRLGECDHDLCIHACRKELLVQNK